MKSMKILSLAFIVSTISSSIFSVPPMISKGGQCSSTPYYLCGATGVTAAFLGYKCYKMNKNIKAMKAEIAALKNSSRE